jgi:hypothetical protein
MSTKEVHHMTYMMMQRRRARSAELHQQCRPDDEINNHDMLSNR